MIWKYFPVALKINTEHLSMEKYFADFTHICENEYLPVIYMPGTVPHAIQISQITA